MDPTSTKLPLNLSKFLLAFLLYLLMKFGVAQVIDSHLIFRKISLLRNNLNNECQVEMILSYTILPVESVIVYYI